MYSGKTIHHFVCAWSLQYYPPTNFWDLKWYIALIKGVHFHWVRKHGVDALYKLWTTYPVALMDIVHEFHAVIIAYVNCT